jgi:hypothetical protein
MKTKIKTSARTVAPARRRKPDDPEQFERFVEAARKAGVDETGETFERAFDKIARPRSRPS